MSIDRENILSEANKLYEEGLYEEAINAYADLLNKATPKQVDESTDPADRIDLLNRLTNACQSAGMTPEHKPYFEGLYETCIPLYGKDNLNTGIAAIKLAKWYRVMKEYLSAIRYFEIALSIHNAERGELHPETLAVTDHLARVCYAARKFGDAQTHFTFLLAQKRRKSEDHDPQLLTAVINAGYSALENRDLKEAQRLLEEAVVKSEGIHGDVSTETLELREKLAGVYHDTGQFEKAVEIIRWIIALSESGTIKNDLGYANACEALADSLKHLRKKETESAIHYEKAIELYAVQLEATDTRLLDAKLKLASVFINKLGDADKGLEVLLELKATLESHKLENTSYAQNTLLQIGDIHFDKEDHNRALVLYQAALKAIEDSGVPAPRRKISLLKRCGQAELKLGNSSRAKEVLFEAHRMASDQYGPRHTRTIALLKLINEHLGMESIEEREGSTSSLPDGLAEYRDFIHTELFSQKVIRQVRVFISSTFRDMMAERDHLMKNIFPELKETCLEHGIEFAEVDLRWGVTEEEAEQGKVIEICLDEIDRSRPYFIGILGERYGWIPDASMYSRIKRTLEKFDWLHTDIKNELSITEMEIQYGVLRNARMEGNAFFYLRDEQLTPDKSFREKAGSKPQKKLNALKDILRQQDQYPVNDYSSIEQLGNQILHDLQKAILRDIDRQQALTDQEMGTLQQLNAMKQLQEFYLPVESSLRGLDELLRKGENKIVLFGESGCGKSALLSHWLTHQFRQDTEDVLLFHFAGADPSADDMPRVLDRITQQLASCFLFENPYDVRSSNPEEGLLKTLSHASISRRIVIVLDGLERFTYKKFFAKLSWLPPNIPDNITFIFSTNEEDFFREATARGFKSLKVNPLTREQNALFISDYLNKFGKKLPQVLAEKILCSPLSEHPLALRILLDELKVFGKHEELETELKNYLSANNTKELFLLVLQRLENDYGESSPGLIARALSAISISEGGLAEHEIIELCNTAQLHWSPIQHALSNYLNRSKGLISIHNQSLQQAIQEKFLPDEQASTRTRKLLAHHLMESGDAVRKVEELGRLLYELGDKKNLAELISNMENFKHFTKQLRYEELIQYVYYVKQEYHLGDRFREKLEAIDPKEEERLDLANTLLEVSRIMELAEYSEEALDFTNRALALRKAALGNDHPHTAEALMKKSNILRNKFQDLKQAKTLYQQAIDILERQTRMAGLNLPMAYISLSEILTHENQLEEAWKCITRSKALLENLLGKNTMALANVYNQMGRIQFLQKNLDAAEDFYLKTLSLLETNLGENHMVYQTCAMNLLEIYEERSEDQKIRDILIKSTQLFSNKLGDAAVWTTTSKFLLASKHFQLQEFDKAAVLAMELVTTAVDHQQLEADYVPGSMSLLRNIYALRGEAHKVDALGERLGIDMNQ